MRVALVIGNSAYRRTAKLKNPGNDAADMALTLKSLGLRGIEGLDLEGVDGRQDDPPVCAGPGGCGERRFLLRGPRRWVGGPI